MALVEFLEVYRYGKDNSVRKSYEMPSICQNLGMKLVMFGLKKGSTTIINARSFREALGVKDECLLKQ